MKGVFLDLDSVHPSDLDLSGIEKSLDELRCYDTTSPDQVLERIIDADVVISNKVVLGKAEINAAASLKLICVAATGYNNIDIEAAREKEISVSNVRRYATESVVEHTFCLILALTRHLMPYSQEARNTTWQQSPYFCLLHRPIVELSSLKLGIIGYGELGKGVAERAKQFGMELMIAESFSGEKDPTRFTLEDIYQQCDIISLHCPLSEKTQNLISSREFDQMKNSAYLINTARGGIVDEQALADALRQGKIAGAGFDVLSVEPPEPDNPLLQPDLTNLILTPHIAWSGRNSRQELINQIANNIRNFRANSPSNVVA